MVARKRRANAAADEAKEPMLPPGGLGHDDAGPSSSSSPTLSSTHPATVTGRQAAREMGPSIVVVAVMLTLIFGGCCSNVYALEAIVNYEPSAGTLLTFCQFLFVAVTGYISQFDRSRPPLFLTPNKVPIRRWIVNIVLFFTINVMNNHAFSYDISVPVHIILRSGGSITTMTAGYMYGKRYTRVQILAVVLLTLGVIMAAWSDAQNKTDSKSNDRPAFSTGLLILFVAQVLSSIMGLYTEATYAKYGPHWRENLFYCHVLSLPLFLPFAPSMISTFAHLRESEPFQFPGATSFLTESLKMPSQYIYLATNVLTQYACIRGVNLLAAVSTALTVTIVLNIRKLVSLLLSIWLFGNQLAMGTLLGAAVVFGSGGLYSVGSKRKVAEETKPANGGHEEKSS